MSSSVRTITEQEKIQAAIFSASSLKSSHDLPKEISLMAVPNEQAEADLQELYGRQLLGWDFNMKVTPIFGFVSNPAHIIKCVAYYGVDNKQFLCAGYAIGSINHSGGAVEIDYIEKRKDSDNDLRSKFLPIIVDAYTLYALYLNTKLNLKINKFVFINPIADKIQFYRDRGYEIVHNYREDCTAAVKYLTEN